MDEEKTQSTPTPPQETPPATPQEAVEAPKPVEVPKPPEATQTKPEEPKQDGRSETSAENGQLGGRPKGSISHTTKLKRMMREILVQQVHDQFGELMQAKFDLAKGHWAYVTKYNEQTKKEEVVRVYQQSPDAKSLEYLIDQVVGKPTSKIAFEEAENLDDIIVTEEEQARIEVALKNIRAFQTEQEKIITAQHESLR